MFVYIYTQKQTQNAMTTLNQIQESPKMLHAIVLKGAKITIDKEYKSIERYTTEGYFDFVGDLRYTKQRSKYYTDEVKFWNAVKRYLKCQK